MAELLSLLTTSITVLSNSIRLGSRLHLPHGASSLPFISTADHNYATRRFPRHPQFAALLLDVRGMRKLEDEILNSPSPRAVMAFKDSHLAAIGGTGVASAILAQLSMTTLQLDGLSDIHWTAAGMILSSLLFGVLSVIVATMQQQAFGMLNDERGVRRWLSCGYYDDQDADRDWDAPRNIPVAHRRRMKASVASLQIMRLPNTFLSFAAVAFLVGMGLFLGFAARQDLDRTPARDNNRAVLALWVTVGGVCVFECAGSSLWKVWEGRKLEERGEEEEDNDRVSGKASQGDEETGRRRRRSSRKSQRDEPPADNRVHNDDSVSDSDNETTHLLQQPTPHGNKSKTSPPTRDDNKASGRDALANALEESAKAHLRAAEADRELARLLLLQGQTS